MLNAGPNGPPIPASSSRDCIRSQPIPILEVSTALPHDTRYLKHHDSHSHALHQSSTHGTLRIQIRPSRSHESWPTKNTFYRNFPNRQNLTAKPPTKGEAAVRRGRSTTSAYFGCGCLTTRFCIIEDLVARLVFLEQLARFGCFVEWFRWGWVWGVMMSLEFDVLGEE